MSTAEKIWYLCRMQARSEGYTLRCRCNKPRCVPCLNRLYSERRNSKRKHKRIVSRKHHAVYMRDWRKQRELIGEYERVMASKGMML